MRAGLVVEAGPSGLSKEDKEALKKDLEAWDVVNCAEDEERHRPRRSEHSMQPDELDEEEAYLGND